MERSGEPITSAEAESLLAWWTDAGVDVLVDEAPRDWLRAAAANTSRVPAKAGTQADSAARTNADWAPALAGAQSSSSAPAQDESPPDQLDLFHGWLKDHPTLPFATPRSPRVCPSGDPASGLMMLADMPASEDCRTGTLLSGEVGKLFDRMLAAIGRDRDTIYLASLSCLRSPDGRIEGEASGRCAALARHHVGLVNPKALLLFGDAPSQALLGLNMARARGRWHELQTQAGPVPTLVTLPPELLLQVPKLKAQAWADLQLLMQGLNS